MNEKLDQEYLQILLDRIAVCKKYKPKFGQGGEGVTLREFQLLYGNDPFYAWFGLDNPLMYAAHKAAGGITSVYRQIGIGVEELFRKLLQDHLGLDEEQSNWSYDITLSSRKTRTLKLDGRIELTHVSNLEQRRVINDWMLQVADYLNLERRVAQAMRGMVIEVRQGYKSKDSKRQNADMANATEAYTQGYFPILSVLSTQIDSDIVDRYERGKWLVLQGVTQGNELTSTYVFVKQVIGYDLAAFFQRNSSQLKDFTEEVLEHLLGAQNDE